MTKSQTAFAMEAIHGYGMDLHEVADLCGCYYRDIYRIQKEVMTFLSIRWASENYREVIVKESKINKE